MVNTFSEIFPFWSKISDEEKDLLLSSTLPVTYKKGTRIHDGEVCTGVIIVRSGSLRLYLSSEEGKEVTLYRLGKGDICMLSASCAVEEITFDVSVDAEADSECYLIPGHVFRAASERNREIKLFALETTVSRFSDVIWVLEQVLFMSLDKRLAVFLLDESSKNGSDTVNLTHEQIAKYMISAREVVTRMLKYFSDEGIVSLSRGGITIKDKAKLRSLAFKKG